MLASVGGAGENPKGGGHLGESKVRAIFSSRLFFACQYATTKAAPIFEAAAAAAAAAARSTAV